MHLDRQETFLGHGVQVAIEAVDDYDAHLIAIDCAKNSMSKLARREFGRINLLQSDESILEVTLDIRVDTLRSTDVGFDDLVENENGRLFVARRRGYGKLRAESRFAAA